MHPQRILLLNAAAWLGAAVLLAACRPISAERAATQGAAAAATAAPTAAAAENAAAPAATLAADAQAAAAAAVSAAAGKLGVDPSQVTIVSVEPVDWPDAGLGCPQPDMMYAAVVTPGYQILLDADGRQAEVHTSTAPNVNAVVCEP